MENQDLQTKLLMAKIDAQATEIARISENLRKIQNYMKWSFVITFIVVILPIIGLFFALPSFISNISEISNLGL